MRQICFSLGAEKLFGSKSIKKNQFWQAKIQIVQNTIKVDIGHKHPLSLLMFWHLPATTP
jgi:hypothetical protein